jgi:hypothetical protein
LQESTVGKPDPFEQNTRLLSSSSMDMMLNPLRRKKMKPQKQIPVVQVLKNGSVNLKKGGKLIAYIAPEIFTEGWAKNALSDRLKDSRFQGIIPLATGGTRRLTNHREGFPKWPSVSVRSDSLGNGQSHPYPLGDQSSI